jgi:tetratricopeptide (TPR) repeat protein
MAEQNIRKSFQEIYESYCQKSFNDEFTLDSINLIFEIGNEIFYKENEEEIESIINRPPSNAPDIMDDEPYSFERSLAIFEQLKPTHSAINPELIQKIFEANSKLAWIEYKDKYFEYVLSIYKEYSDDEYINYLASVILYEEKNYQEALHCINLSIAQNGSSSLYTHMKGLCLMQLGEFESARTYFYQALFLIELLQDIPPRLKGNPEVYPNYPIEYHTSADLVRLDLNKLDKVDAFYDSNIIPLVESQSV